jgi:drug/metabolite transporter (DMT)-like permease
MLRSAGSIVDVPTAAAEVYPAAMPGEEVEMAESAASGAGFGWLFYALMTVVLWGLYGVLLHSGQTGMADPVNGRYKAFLFVGVAYMLTAVLAPLILLLSRGSEWSFPPGGVAWSLLAGIVGAAGAFGVLLAFGANGSPASVMSIIFAGAPIVNATVALLWHPPAGGLASLRWQFVVGILLAALGGFLVTAYKPPPAPAASHQLR